MKKAILFIAAILACAGLAMAQETPSSGASSQQGSTANQPADQNSGNTVRGCLTGTSGNYTLTDAMGMSYKVQGDDSQLSQNVNKEVEVTTTTGAGASASTGNTPDASASSGNASASGGNTPEAGTQGSNPSAQGEANSNSGAASSNSNGSNATATATKTLDVTSVKTVADSCNSSK